MGSTSALNSLLAPVTFNGTSKYSSDLQQVLSRAVAIQSLPLGEMQNQLSSLQAKQSAFSGLGATFNALGTAIQNIGSSIGAVTAASTNPSAVSVSASSNALPGTFTVQVNQVGSSTTTISGAGSPVVTDPTTGNISLSASFTLTINGTNTTITPSGSSLDALATAINSAGLNVQATVVNVGSNSSPDYRLSLTSTRLAADTIQLNDGTNNLLTTLSPGAPTTYQVNGLNTVLQTNTPQITLAPGVTANLLQQTSGFVSVTVAQNSSSLSNSLSNFVSAYNAAVDALNAQHGQNAGALAGDGTVLQLGQALTSITEYSGGANGFTTLADLGLTLDPATGHLSFDATVLGSANASTVQQFLGSISSGGFLQSASSTMTSLTDPASGIIQDSLNALQNSISNENDQIAAQQNLINTFQTNLTQQLSAADTTLSLLQSKLTYMTNLFATMLPGANNSNSGTGTAG
ncbi:MAG TPA: flagellar filament capping protein FliD [Bryobacteraceae bacterium]|nr:flagellar filament capping protein FliD [Bryobacteraceae bacterium]